MTDAITGGGMIEEFVTTADVGETMKDLSAAGEITAKTVGQDKGLAAAAGRGNRLSEPTWVMIP